MKTATLCSKALVLEAYIYDGSLESGNEIIRTFYGTTQFFYWQEVPDDLESETHLLCNHIFGKLTFVTDENGYRVEAGDFIVKFPDGTIDVLNTDTVSGIFTVVPN